MDDLYANFITHAMFQRCTVTHHHLYRVSIYATELARALGWLEKRVEAVRLGALLHDCGKVFTPEHILQKPGKLTLEEFEIIKEHPRKGAEWLRVLRPVWNSQFIPMVLHHHENWDGSGYPDGLSGYDIPDMARLMTVVDCYDAMREERPYKPGLSRDEAIKNLLDNRATRYDPVIVERFCDFVEFLEVRRRDHLLEFSPTRFVPTEAACNARPGAGLAENPPADEQHRETPIPPELEKRGL